MEKTIFDVLETRATCRNFLPDLIEEPVLEQMYSAAASAPSGGGFQNISIIEVSDEADKQRLAQFSRGQGFIAKAPINLVFCVDHRRTWRIAEHEYAPKDPVVDVFDFILGVVDAAISAQTLCLAGETLGVRSCFNGNILQQIDEICEMLSIPKYVLPVFMVTIGYPAGKAAPLSGKYPWNLLVSRNRYCDMDMQELYAAYEKKTGTNHIKSRGTNLIKLYETAEKRYGAKWAKECMDRVQVRGELTPLQFWLGCFYAERAGSLDAETMKQLFHRQGFQW